MRATAALTWRTALRRPVMRRAAVMSGLVGTVLAGINHGDAILAGPLGQADALGAGVTYLIPYTVSTVSSLFAIRDMALQAQHRSGYLSDRLVKILERIY